LKATRPIGFIGGRLKRILLFLFGTIICACGECPPDIRTKVFVDYGHQDDHTDQEDLIDDNQEEKLRYRILGNVEGLLDGDTLEVFIDVSEEIIKVSNGPFRSSILELQTNNTQKYNLTLSLADISHEYMCFIKNGSGTVTGKNITNVMIRCICGTSPWMYDLSDEEVEDILFKKRDMHNGMKEQGRQLIE